MGGKALVQRFHIQLYLLYLIQAEAMTTMGLEYLSLSFPTASGFGKQSEQHTGRPHSCSRP